MFERIKARRVIKARLKNLPMQTATQFDAQARQWERHRVPIVNVAKDQEIIDDHYKARFNVNSWLNNYKAR